MSPDREHVVMYITVSNDSLQLRSLLISKSNITFPKELTGFETLFLGGSDFGIKIPPTQNTIPTH